MKVRVTGLVSSYWQFSVINLLFSSLIVTLYYPKYTIHLLPFGKTNCTSADKDALTASH